MRSLGGFDRRRQQVDEREIDLLRHGGVDLDLVPLAKSGEKRRVVLMGRSNVALIW